MGQLAPSTTGTYVYDKRQLQLLVVEEGFNCVFKKYLWSVN